MAALGCTWHRKESVMNRKHWFNNRNWCGHLPSEVPFFSMNSVFVDEFLVKQKAQVMFSHVFGVGLRASNRWHVTPTVVWAGYHWERGSSRLDVCWEKCDHRGAMVYIGVRCTFLTCNFYNFMRISSNVWSEIATYFYICNDSPAWGYHVSREKPWLLLNHLLPRCLA